MKLSIEILKVESAGDGVRVHGQGRQKNAGDWAQWHTCDFVVPIGQRKAYYVGRTITVEITP